MPETEALIKPVESAGDPSAGLGALRGLFAHRPELLAGFEKFQASIAECKVLSPRVLELCRLRVAAIHGAQEVWQMRDPAVQLADEELQALQSGDIHAACFSAADSAALAVAEAMPYNHHGLEDRQVAALSEAYTHEGCVNLLTAVAFFDVSCRWQLVLRPSQAKPS